MYKPFVHLSVLLIHRITYPWHAENESIWYSYTRERRRVKSEREPTTSRRWNIQEANESYTGTPYSSIQYLGFVFHIAIHMHKGTRLRTCNVWVSRQHFNLFGVRTEYTLRIASRLFPFGLFRFFFYRDVSSYISASRDFRFRYAKRTHTKCEFARPETWRIAHTNFIKLFFFFPSLPTYSDVAGIEESFGKERVRKKKK